MQKCPKCSSKEYDNIDVPVVHIHYDYFEKIYHADITIYARCAKCRVVSKHIVQRKTTEEKLVKIFKW